MLDLQRASAGSGKTYTLAKKYLWYLITIRPESEPTRLRTRAEVMDSAKHILAVTFTNKATNEMQMRIVDKLFALAYPPQKGNPDYQDEFCKKLGVTPDEISATCRIALSALLNNYSDFNVSTIDSFFQTVLRTFAYETDISDTYQVELDSKYLSQLGIDATLEEIDSNEKDTSTPFWIRTLMDRTESGVWNMFQKKLNSGNNFSANPYEDLIKALSRLENEQYKRIRDDVEEYIDSKVDFSEVYKALRSKYEEPVNQAYRAMLSAAKETFSILPDELKYASPKTLLYKPAIACRRIIKSESGYRKTDLPDSSIIPDFEASFFSKPSVRNWLNGYPEFGPKLQASLQALTDAISAWVEVSNTEEFRHWNLYRHNLPFFGLFGVANRKRREYLEENNAVELGETAMILKGIIGDSDTPFIYERLGTYLNHFLIDEFQDTSGLQWKILSPLLHESMSRDNDNLIIGDAKQSIYRFRNADPSLITTRVPAEFRGRVNSLGDAPAENTNWRSALRVVRFNNSLFHYVARRMEENAPATPNGSERISYSALYSNVKQPPHHKEDDGYVEFSLIEGSKQLYTDNVGLRVVELLKRLHSRGYAWKDIAILVDTNSNGTAIIDYIVADNNRLPEGAEKIPFVSEQSLKVISSRAVRIITDVLGSVARGAKPKIREGEERRKRGVGNWADMSANFRFYAMQASDGKSHAELMDEFIATGAEMDRLHDMLAGMQSVAIPALVEAIIAEFIPENIRRADALYLAAFQDIVLEYCDAHPTDIASFLHWWKRRSLSAAIASPEDTDAVKIVTVHKSKGLEYKCVIVPFANWNFEDALPSSNKVEWNWVKPTGIEIDGYKLPPYIPVNVSSNLIGTHHEHLLYRYYDMAKMDDLNSAYVAFTRAEKELYIFSQKPGARSSGGMAGSYISEFLNYLMDSDGAREDERSLAGSDIRRNETGDCFRIGEPCEVTKNEVTNSKTRVLSDYLSHGAPEYLKYREKDLPRIVDAEDMDIDEDSDPRSEGNIKHAVLERVKVASDLPRAVKHLEFSGLIDSVAATEILAQLTIKLANPTAARWFDGTARVINERPILQAGKIFRRPDRILVYEDGHAEVVDYKFGKIDTTGRHRRQVSNYVRNLARTGVYTQVEGYLWYVNEDRIEKI